MQPAFLFRRLALTCRGFRPPLRAFAYAAKPTFDVKPLAVAVGAEVRNFNYTHNFANDANTMKDLRRVLVERSVVLIRGLNFNEEELVNFSKHLGTLEMPPANEIAAREAAGAHKAKEIWIISNVKENGKPIGSLGDSEAEWHTDMSYIETPPHFSVLHAKEVPPASAGGNTSFSSQFASHDTLPPSLRAKIEGKFAKHDATYTSTGQLRKGNVEYADVRQTPGAIHPIVRTHPLPEGHSRKALYLGRRTNGYIVGMSVADSEQLLDELWAHAGQKAFVYEHTWAVGDLLVWDNCSVVHHRKSFDPNTRRVMLRTQVQGTKPI